MKNNYTLKITLLLFAFAAYMQVQAQMTAHEARIAMGRGINLGNTFDAPNFEGEWAQAAQENYFEMYAEAGFKTVRVPITWNKRFGTEAPYTIDPIFLARIDTIIAWCLKYDLFVSINVHHDEWAKNTETFDATKPRLYALWTQLSEHYKNYSQKLMFEIINEPHYEEGGVSKSLTQAQLYELNKTALEIIRATNPTRIVFYGGIQWSNSNELITATIPDATDKYLIGYYHSYDPWSFAGEGKDKWGTTDNINAMKAQMQSVQDWSVENDIPVLIGEFGAVKKCDYNSRMFYYATYVEQALAHNLAFTVWDDGGDFQVLLRGTGKWNELKDILVHTSDTSPTKLKAKIENNSSVKLSWTSRLQTKEKVYVEKRTNLNTDYTTIAEFGQVSGTTDVVEYIDTDVADGKTYYYRVVEELNGKLIPSYPLTIGVKLVSVNDADVNDFAVYPNPASTQITVDFKGEQVDALSIYNSKGALVKTESGFGSAVLININQLNSGIYFLIANTPKGVKKSKFVKQ